MIARLLGRFARRRSARLLESAPREFFLLCACCRWPPGAARDRAVQAAASEAIDWERLARLVERHRLFGLVRDSLSKAGVAAPAWFDAALAARVLAMAKTNLALAGETMRLHEAFAEAKIEVLFVKGATLEALLYRDFAIKHSQDIDLLVRPEDSRAARALLEGLGYRLIGAPPPVEEFRLALMRAGRREWEFRHETRRIVVELHWRLVYNEHLARGVDLSAPKQWVRIGERDAPTLARAPLFVYLCAHGAQHGWARLKWLADLAALLAQAGDTPELFRAAEEAGAGRCAAQALALCETLFGLEPPEALSAKLRGGVADMLSSIALRAILSSDSKPAWTRLDGQVETALSTFLLGSDRAFLFAEFRRYLVAPEDVATFPLPERLAWLYALLRGPFWVLRRLDRYFARFRA